jgi:hypothetical protein
MKVIDELDAPAASLLLDRTLIGPGANLDAVERRTNIMLLSGIEFDSSVVPPVI